MIKPRKEDIISLILYITAWGLLSMSLNETIKQQINIVILYGLSAILIFAALWLSTKKKKVNKGEDALIEVFAPKIAKRIMEEEK